MKNFLIYGHNPLFFYNKVRSGSNRSFGHKKSEKDMMENQELLNKANARVASLEQKIAFRAKGKHGIYIAELAKAKGSTLSLYFSCIEILNFYTNHIIIIL